MICCIHINGIIDILAKIAVAGGVAFAAFEYFNSVRLSKSKWLHDLYKSFYENGTYYKEVRQILDYANSTKKDTRAKYESFKKNFGTDNDIDLQEKLVDYLNFFEFIATLLELKQISLNEVNLVFGYYILNLSKHEFTSNEKLSANGFTNLSDLIDEIKKLRAK